MATIRQQIIFDAKDNTKRDFDKVKSNVSTLDKSFARLKVTMLGIVGIHVFQSIVGNLLSVSNGMVDLEGKLRLVTDGTAEYNATLERLNTISLSTGSAIQDNALLFTRLQPAVKALGYETKTTLDFTDALAKSLRISSATTAQTSSVITQMSQAMQSGVLSGDEYRSMAENGGRAMTALAESLGVTKGELRAMSKEQLLTSDVVLPALISQLSELNAENAQLPLSISRGWVNLKTEFALYVHKAKEGNLAVGSALDKLSQNLDSVADAIVLIGTGFVAFKLKALLAQRAVTRELIATAEVERKIEADRVRSLQLANIARLNLIKNAKQAKYDELVHSNELLLIKSKEIEANNLLALNEAKYARDKAKQALDEIKASENQRTLDLKLSNARLIQLEREKQEIIQLRLEQIKLNKEKSKPLAGVKTGNKKEYEALIKEEIKLNKELEASDNKVTKIKISNKDKVAKRYKQANKRIIVSENKVKRAIEQVGQQRLRNAGEVDSQSARIEASNKKIKRSIDAVTLATERANGAQREALITSVNNAKLVKSSYNHTSLQLFAHSLGALNDVAKTGQSRFTSLKQALYGTNKSLVESYSASRKAESGIKGLGRSITKLSSLAFGLVGVFGYMGYEIANKFFDVNLAVELTYVAIKRFVAESIVEISKFISYLPAFGLFNTAKFRAEMDLALESIETNQQAFDRIYADRDAKLNGYADADDRRKRRGEEENKKLIASELLYSNAITALSEKRQAQYDFQAETQAKSNAYYIENLKTEEIIQVEALREKYTNEQDFTRAVEKLKLEYRDRLATFNRIADTSELVDNTTHFDNMLALVKNSSKATRIIEEQKAKKLIEINRKINANNRASITAWINDNKARTQAITSLNDEIRSLTREQLQFNRDQQKGELEAYQITANAIGDIDKINKELQHANTLDKVKDAGEIYKIQSNAISQLKEIASAEKARSNDYSTNSIEYINATNNQKSAVELINKAYATSISVRKSNVKLIEAERKAVKESIDAKAKSIIEYSNEINKLDALAVKNRDIALHIEVGKSNEIIDKLKDKLDQLRAKIKSIPPIKIGVEQSTITVTSDQPQQQPIRRQQGGYIKREGKLKGYGGGDRVKALLEDGEFILNKEAVKRLGDKRLYELNQGVGEPIKRRTGGAVGISEAEHKRRLRQALEDEKKATSYLDRLTKQGANSRAKALAQSQVDNAIKITESVKNRDTANVFSSEKVSDNDQTGIINLMIERARASYNQMLGDYTRGFTNGTTRSFIASNVKFYGQGLLESLGAMDSKPVDKVRRALEVNSDIMRVIQSTTNPTEQINKYLQERATLLGQSLNIPTISGGGNGYDGYNVVNFDGTPRLSTFNRKSGNSYNDRNSQGGNVKKVELSLKIGDKILTGDFKDDKNTASVIEEIRKAQNAQ